MRSRAREVMGVNLIHVPWVGSFRLCANRTLILLQPVQSGGDSVTSGLVYWYDTNGCPRQVTSSTAGSVANSDSIP
jgi:hypothetical protein